MPNLYIYGERPKRFNLFKILTDGLAVFGAVTLIALIVDTIFFNNNGFTNLLILLWEVTS